MYSPPVAPTERCAHAIPREVEALVLELLAKEPTQRPGSARELLFRLRALPVRRWSEEELAAWWASAMEQRAKARAHDKVVSSPASAQTLAVDLRARAHLDS